MKKKKKYNDVCLTLRIESSSQIKLLFKVTKVTCFRFLHTLCEVFLLRRRAMSNASLSEGCGGDVPILALATTPSDGPLMVEHGSSSHHCTIKRTAARGCGDHEIERVLNDWQDSNLTAASYGGGVWQQQQQQAACCMTAPLPPPSLSQAPHRNTDFLI